jgi:hypothetical protein
VSEGILKILGEMILYGGGGAAVAYLIFQFLGKSWIENKFAQRLEQHKHQQALEIQRLRVEIDSMLSGALKVQEREFKILPEAWEKLDEAYGLTIWLTHPAQEFPAVGRMSDAELEEFFASSELRETQKQTIRSADSRDRDKAYQNIIFWHRLGKVKKAVGELQSYIARNGIFLPKSLKEKFAQMIPLLWSAVTAAEVGQESADYKMRNEGWKELDAKGKPLHAEIESEIQRRLQSHASKS